MAEPSSTPKTKEVAQDFGQTLLCGHKTHLFDQAHPFCLECILKGTKAKGVSPPHIPCTKEFPCEVCKDWDDSNWHCYGTLTQELTASLAKQNLLRSSPLNRQNLATRAQRIEKELSGKSRVRGPWDPLTKSFIPLDPVRPTDHGQRVELASPDPRTGGVQDNQGLRQSSLGRVPSEVGRDSDRLCLGTSGKAGQGLIHRHTPTSLRTGQSHLDSRLSTTGKVYGEPLEPIGTSGGRYLQEHRDRYSDPQRYVEPSGHNRDRYFQGMDKYPDSQRYVEPARYSQDRYYDEQLKYSDPQRHSTTSRREVWDTQPSHTLRTLPSPKNQAESRTSPAPRRVSFPQESYHQDEDSQLAEIILREASDKGLSLKDAIRHTLRQAKLINPPQFSLEDQYDQVERGSDTESGISEEASFIRARTQRSLIWKSYAETLREMLPSIPEHTIPPASGSRMVDMSNLQEPKYDRLPLHPNLNTTLKNCSQELLNPLPRPTSKSTKKPGPYLIDETFATSRKNFPDFYLPGDLPDFVKPMDSRSRLDAMGSASSLGSLSVSDKDLKDTELEYKRSLSILSIAHWSHDALARLKDQLAEGQDPTEAAQYLDVILKEQMEYLPLLDDILTTGLTNTVLKRRDLLLKSFSSLDLSTETITKIRASDLTSISLVEVPADLIKEEEAKRTQKTLYNFAKASASLAEKGDRGVYKSFRGSNYKPYSRRNKNRGSNNQSGSQSHFRSNKGSTNQTQDSQNFQAPQNVPQSEPATSSYKYKGYQGKKTPNKPYQKGGYRGGRGGRWGGKQSF